VPNFPLLGALPDGHGANPLAWCLLVGTPLLAGGVVARTAWRAGAWRARLLNVCAAVAMVGAAVFVLTWQAGGGIGSGRLGTVGASPWQVGLIVAAETAVLGVGGLGLIAAGRWLRSIGIQHTDGWALRGSEPVGADDRSDDHGAEPAPRRLTMITASQPNDGDDADELAG
jgi:hypothetical protein